MTPPRVGVELSRRAIRTGEAPHGPLTLPLEPNAPGSLEPQPQPFYLSDAGRLFFDSQDSLSPL